MKLEIVNPFGYCSGVQRAIDIAIETKKKYNDVCILGMLVHNSDTILKLKDLGITTIYDANKTLEQLIDLIPLNYKVILTAHGHSKMLEKQLIERNIDFIDATCPMVKQIEDIIASYTNDEIIYIGKKNHPETNACLSFGENIKLHEFGNTINKEDFKTKNPLIISQTTFSKADIENEIEYIKTIFPYAKVINGVCNASDLRQKGVKNIPNTADCIIVIGGFNSNNTKTLYNLARTTHPNALIIQTENLTQINKQDLKGLNEIYLVSGASTSKETTVEIFNFLANN